MKIRISSRLMAGVAPVALYVTLSAVSHAVAVPINLDCTPTATGENCIVVSSDAGAAYVGGSLIENTDIVHDLKVENPVFVDGNINVTVLNQVNSADVGRGAGSVANSLEIGNFGDLAGGATLSLTNFTGDGDVDNVVRFTNSGDINAGITVLVTNQVNRDNASNWGTGNIRNDILLENSGSTGSELSFGSDNKTGQGNISDRLIINNSGTIENIIANSTNITREGNIDGRIAIDNSSADPENRTNLFLNSNKTAVNGNIADEINIINRNAGASIFLTSMNFITPMGGTASGNIESRITIENSGGTADQAALVQISPTNVTHHGDIDSQFSLTNSDVTGMLSVSLTNVAGTGGSGSVANRIDIQNSGGGNSANLFVDSENTAFEGDIDSVINVQNSGDLALLYVTDNNYVYNTTRSNISSKISLRNSGGEPSTSSLAMNALLTNFIDQGNIDTLVEMENSGAVDTMLLVATNVTNTRGNIDSVTKVLNSGTVNGGVLLVAEEVARNGTANSRLEFENTGTIGGVVQSIQTSTQTEGRANSRQSIVNRGVMEEGVLVAGNSASAEIVNYGTIDGDEQNSWAIMFATDGHNTLTNHLGSRITGAINMGSTGGTVNFRGGNWLFEFENDLDDLDFDAGDSAVVLDHDRRRVAVYDGKAAIVDELNMLDLMRNLGGIARSRFGYEPAGGSGADEAGGVAPAITLWGQGFAGKRDQSLSVESEASLGGGAVGGDLAIDSRLQLGFLFGGARAKAEVESTQRIDSEYLFGGIYGNYSWDRAFVSFNVLAGTSESDSVRIVASNLAAGGVEALSASYDGRFISPEIGIGTNWVSTQGLVVTPSASVRYLAARLDGYTETGPSPAAATIGRRSIQDLEGRLEMAFSGEPLHWGGGQSTLRTGLIGIGRMGDKVDAVLLDAAATLSMEKSTYGGGYVGLDVDVNLAGGVSLFGGVEGVAWSDGSMSGGAQGGLKLSF